MVIKVYMDYSSQPSRAVLAFCLAAKIPHEVVEVVMNDGDHRKPEFLKINPMKRVPAIHDTDCDLFLAESHTILRYLCAKYNAPEHWYPRKDLVHQAKTNEFLDFHHSATRKCSYLAYHLLFASLFKSGDPTFNEKYTRKIVASSLRSFEQIYLKDNRFVGGENPSIGDLIAFYDITMLEVLDYDFAPYPKIERWIKEMEKIPEVSKANQRFVSKKSIMRSLNPKAKL